MLDASAPTKLRFRLLGQTTLDSGGSDTVRISAQKGFALLVYLAMHPGRAVSRSVLADLLWSDRGEAQARQNLRQAILTLRRDLRPSHSAILQADDQSVTLAADAADVDAVQFAAWAGATDPVERQRCLDAPWGSFLDGFSVGAEAFDSWVVAERHRLDSIATKTFAELASQLDAAGDGERAIRALERLIAIDPGEEERHRRLLSLEARYRGADAALAEAKRLAAMLRRELDVDPEPATRALVEEIRASAAACRLGHPTGGKSTALAAENADPVRTAIPATAPKSSPPRQQSYWRIAAAGLLLVLIGGGLSLLVQYQAALAPSSRSVERDLRQPRTDGPWQSPRLSSQRADDSVAPGRGLVAIAVLPFTSHSDAAGDRDVADMVTDDLTYMLSRAPAFRVISRQTMMSYLGQTVDAEKVGLELGVHYLLEGDASTRGNVLRVTVALVDTRTRLQIWSGSFERAGEDRHALQTEIVNGLGRELQFSVSAVEGARVSSHPDVNALIFRGYAAIQDSRRHGVEGLRPAETYFLQALQRDPAALRATIGLGVFHTHMAVQLFAPDPAPHLAKAESILQPIIERYPGLSEPHATMGLVHVARGEMKKAIAAFERALVLNPSNAPSHAQIGRALVRIGRPAEGRDHIRYAMKLSPRDPVIGYWYAFAGYAELELGNYDKAIEYVGRSHLLNPTQPRTLLTLIAANALVGNLTVARQQLARLQQNHPHLTHERLQKMYGRREQTTRLVEGIFRALVAAPNNTFQIQH